MSDFSLYRGLWPQNISKLAKYAVRMVDGEWKVTVNVEVGEGLRFLAVEGKAREIVERVNAIKDAKGGKHGGAFYVNEYGHLLVPTSEDGTSAYYFGGKVVADFTFEFEGKALSTRPIHSDGRPLNPGEQWVGPRPGIPYVLAAGGNDIYFESPALTETEPPVVRANVTRKALLSKALRDGTKVARAARPIRNIRGERGGRFYVNEHGAIFTPVDLGSEDGIRYIYCGQIEREFWFPEPAVEHA